MTIKMSEVKLVLVLYYISFLCLLLTIVDNVPFIGLLSKTRYLYMLLVGFFCVKDKIIIYNKRFMIAFGLLIVHTILYGFIFINSYISAEISSHAKQLLVIYLYMLITLLYVYKNNIFQQFLECSFLALTTMIFWSAITHFDDFVNPIYYVNIFSRSTRFRADFGMSDVNYCGNYCLYEILLLIYLIHYWKSRSVKLSLTQKVIVCFAAIISVTMLFSTASRSAILSLAIFCGLLLVPKCWSVFIRRWKLLVPIFTIILLAVSIALFANDKVSEVWTESNREGNFYINYPIFLEYGDIINGMGYADNSLYLTKGYGYGTTAMDVYYLYILFCSGILGSIIVFGQMIYILYQVIRNSKMQNSIWIISLYFMMLFYCVWQVNYMNYRYFTSIIHMVVIFYFLLKIKEEEDTKWIYLGR